MRGCLKTGDRPASRRIGFDCRSVHGLDQIEAVKSTMSAPFKVLVDGSLRSAKICKHWQIAKHKATADSPDSP